MRQSAHPDLVLGLPGPTCRSARLQWPCGAALWVRCQGTLACPPCRAWPPSDAAVQGSHHHTADAPGRHSRTPRQPTRGAPGSELQLGVQVGKTTVRHWRAPDAALTARWTRGRPPAPQGGYLGILGPILEVPRWPALHRRPCTHTLGPTPGGQTCTQAAGLGRGGPSAGLCSRWGPACQAWLHWQGDRPSWGGHPRCPWAAQPATVLHSGAPHMGAAARQARCRVAPMLHTLSGHARKAAAGAAGRWWQPGSCSWSAQAGRCTAGLHGWTSWVQGHGCLAGRSHPHPGPPPQATALGPSQVMA